ncbi:MAG: hypothetical protein KBD48_02650 [Candidatus Pacebacteria bacterium]|nr:hypothetical protein [Candidatus Paceibacterota bacterium]MBP9716062.1 hypothetical protein [Candidatus Paceibacterota bacterium]
MKKSLILLSLMGLLLSFTVVKLQNTLPDRIVEYGHILGYQKNFEEKDYGIDLPKTFYDPKIAKILSDSFLVNNPVLLLKIQAFALKSEQESYTSNKWNVSVAYGMMPFCGGTWEHATLSFFQNEAKKYVVSKLIRDRVSQVKLYNWAKPTIIAAWVSKKDNFQAVDMFAVWKANQYLVQYDYRSESLREKVIVPIKYRYGQNNEFESELRLTYTCLDWKNNEDDDAKLYAFWHRRIKEHQKTGSGFSLADAKYWNQIAFNDMFKNATTPAKALFDSWKKMWLKDHTNPTKEMIFAQK